jgi:hypothetical protein
MFRKIGQFEITQEADLITVWSSPVFNLESAQEYAAAMTVMIERMPKAFGVLATFDAPPIIGPEVEASMCESAARRAARGMIAVAFVVPAGEGRLIASHQWARIYRSVDVLYQMFATLEPARAWLRERIDAANAAGPKPGCT